MFKHNFSGVFMTICFYTLDASVLNNFLSPVKNCVNYIDIFFRFFVSSKFKKIYQNINKWN